MSTPDGEETWSSEAEYPEMRAEVIFASRVVRCFRDRPRSLYQLFTDGLDTHRHDEALVCGQSRTTYEQLDLTIGGVAAGLLARGVAKGSRVAFLLPNCPEYVAVILAFAKIGAIGVPLNIGEAAPELSFILNDCQAEMLICCSDLARGLPDLDAIPALRVVATVDLSSEHPLAPFQDIPGSDL